jgi:hypothetical protein
MNYTIAIAEDNKAYLNSFLHKLKLNVKTCNYSSLPPTEGYVLNS